MTTRREAFEAWAVGILGDTQTWRESGDCEIAWQAWKESRKVALEDAAQVCHELESAYGSLADSGLFTNAGRTLHDGMYGGAHNCAIKIKGLK